MDDWAQVDVPANHSVMVSFVRVDIEQDYVGNCGFDSLTVYIGKRKGSSNVNREKSNNATTLVLCNPRKHRVPHGCVVLSLSQR